MQRQERVSKLAHTGAKVNEAERAFATGVTAQNLRRVPRPHGAIKELLDVRRSALPEAERMLRGTASPWACAT